MMKDTYVLGMARTPVGSFGGSLSKISAVDLGAHSIRHAIANAGVSTEDVEEVFMGQVLQAGSGQAPQGKPPFLRDCRRQLRVQPSTRCVLQA